MRIHIIGGPGSGKSFLASLLATRYGLPAFDLDQLFWQRSAERYGARACPEDRDSRLAELVAGDRWVIEGVYYSWLDPSFERAHLIVILNVSRPRRLVRILSRYLKRKLRLVPGKHESVRDLLRLVAWNHHFDSRNLPQFREHLEPYAHKMIECDNSHASTAAIGAMTANNALNLPVRASRPLLARLRPTSSRTAAGKGRATRPAG